MMLVANINTIIDHSYNYIEVLTGTDSKNMDYMVDNNDNNDNKTKTKQNTIIKIDNNINKTQESQEYSFWPYYDQNTSKLFAGFNANDSNLQILSESNYGQTFLYASIQKGYEDRYYGQTFEEAFVSFFKGKQYGMHMDVIIDAVHSFSNRPILVFIDVNVKTSNQYYNMSMKWFQKYKRLVVFEMPSHPLKIWFDKFRAILLAPVKKGVIVEADTIITPDANRLFLVLDFYNNSNYPIAPQHPDLRAPNNGICSILNLTETCPACCSNPYPYPWTKRSTQYRHAHIMWKKSHRNFIAKILFECLNGKNNINHLDCSSDESSLNHALWNANATFQLCLIDPFSSFWENEHYSIHRLGNRTIGFYFNHGCKDITKSRNILNQFKQYFGTNLTTSRETFIYEAYTRKRFTIQQDKIFEGHGVFGEKCFM